MNDNAKPLYKIWYRKQYLNSVCHICQKDNDDSTLSCPICGLVFYCGLEHLEEDRDDHEEICESFQSVAITLGSKHVLDRSYLLGPEEHRQFRLGLVGLCSRFLGRPLQPWEIEVCLYPPVCSTCHKFERNLKVCSECLSSRWCSDEHKPTTHNEFCGSLKLFKNAIQERIPSIYAPHMSGVPKDMNCLATHTDDHLRFSLLSEIATSPLTILSALTTPTPETTVHLIGPEPHFEANNLVKWELFLLNLVPTVSKLNFHFIGPEIGPLPQRNIIKNNRSLHLSFHQKLYHDYVSTNPSSPTLICALNPGLYRAAGFNGQDSWSSTISCMFQNPGTPVLITAYTRKEIHLDVRRVQSQIKNVKTIEEPQRNPFSSLRPLMNFVSEEETPIVFKNAFYALLST